MSERLYIVRNGSHVYPPACLGAIRREIRPRVAQWRRRRRIVALARPWAVLAAFFGASLAFGRLDTTAVLVCWLGWLGLCRLMPLTRREP